MLWLVCSLIFVQGNIVQAMEKSEVPAITLRSRVEKTVKANMAEVRFGVRIQDSNLQNAQAQVNNSIKSVVDAMRFNEISAEDIQTNRYSVQNFNKDNQDRNITYVVENNITVKVRDINKLGNIIDSALENGANQFYGISFVYDGDDKIKEQLLKQAVINGRKQANIILGADGRSAGKILRAEVYGVESQMFNANDSAYASMRSAAYKGGGSKVFAGDVVLSAEVNLSFEIE